MIHRINAPVLFIEDRLQLEQQLQPLIDPVLPICFTCDSSFFCLYSQPHVTPVAAIHDGRMNCGSKEADDTEVCTPLIDAYVSLGTTAGEKTRTYRYCMQRSFRILNLSLSSADVSIDIQFEGLSSCARCSETLGVRVEGRVEFIMPCCSSCGIVRVPVSIVQGISRSTYDSDFCAIGTFATNPRCPLAYVPKASPFLYLLHEP